MSKSDFKGNFDKFKKIFLNEKVQWGIVITLLFVVLFLSSSIRLSNLNLLKDETTGNYIPMALDPFYFLRLAETILENGSLPEFDEYRAWFGYSEQQWVLELLPYSVVGMYKFVNLFSSNITLNFIDVISPVVFFILGGLIFFFLNYALTKNKWLSILSTTFLSFTSAYLYRTMTGFADHEAIGMVGLFLSYLSFVYIMKVLDNDKIKLSKIIIGSLLVGLASFISFFAWGGGFRFLLVIFPLTTFLYWIFNVREKEHFGRNTLIVYYSWMAITLLFTGIFNLGMKRVFDTYFMATSGIVSLFVAVFIFIDFIVVKKIDLFKFIKKKYRILYSLFFTFIAGFLGLFAIGKNPVKLIFAILNYLLKPFGSDRVGLTVAENAQPYLVDWINNTGAIIFWLFVFGMLFFGIKLMRSLKEIKHKSIFLFLYIFMICGILFSRISSTSVFNGDGFLSKIFYFLPLICFWVYLFHLRFEEKFVWSGMDSFIFAWMFFTLISGRAAARMFFAITPLVCFMAAYCIIRLVEEFKRSKDDMLKILLGILIVFSLVISVVGVAQSYTSINYAAKYTGLSADSQWQNTMAWVRENTTSFDIFGHWWDYGYWVQTLGERTTIADGGYHPNYLVHFIGRYVLTTPNPETAFSYLKTTNVSYLLIDQTDLGKYSAYSKIGSDENWDRFSVIPVGKYDATQTQESANETVMIYYMQGVVDEDFSYDSNFDGKKDILLPGPTYDDIGNPSYNSYLGAVIFRIGKDNLLQPNGIYILNGKQYRIPIRYVYLNNELYDFKSGIDAVISIVPSVETNKVDPLGGMIYLSPKVKDSLFAQLYLLDDVFGNYENFELVHEELDSLVSQVRAFTEDFNYTEFLIYNGGLRGPIKIWDVRNISEEVETYDEFHYDFVGKEEYGYLDSLFE